MNQPLHSIKKYWEQIMNTEGWQKMNFVTKSAHFILVCAVCFLYIKLLIFNYGEGIKYYFKEGSVVYEETRWMKELIVYLTGFAIVLVPFFNLYIYFCVTEYFEKRRYSTSMFTRLLGTIFGPAVPTSFESLLEVDTKRSYSTYEPIYYLAELFILILVRDAQNYSILNKNYTMADGSYMVYYDEYFLVFADRLAACVTPLIFLVLTSTPIIDVPLHKFIYCSVTHILSSFCFYEGIKYVEFAFQVKTIWRSWKVIPVMLMGWLLFGKKDSRNGYVSATLISVGMTLFLFGADNSKLTLQLSSSSVTLILLYFMCTSFTFVWQEHLFTIYKVEPLQMMVGINLWTVIIYGATLAQHHNLEETMKFFKIPEFVMDLAMLVLVSALSDVLILKTINKFGAVLFTIMMIIRFEMSILLMCVMEGRWLSPWASGGALFVFLMGLHKIYNTQHRRRTTPILAPTIDNTNNNQNKTYEEKVPLYDI